MFYNFFLNMWILRKLDEEYLQGQANKKRITVEEKEMILATPQASIKNINNHA